MVEIARREAMFGAMFAALGAGCFFLLPKRAFARLSEGQLEKAIPERIGAYRVQSTEGLILPPEDELSKKLYDKVLTRIYVAPGLPPIMALFAYGSTQNLTLQLHRPDECYPMQGFALTPLAPTPIRMAGRTIPANFTTASRPERTEQVLFWSRVGDQFPPNRTQETLVVAKDNLRGWMPDGLLVRLSVIDDDRAAVLGQLRGFAQTLGESLPAAGRRVVMGSA